MPIHPTAVVSPEAVVDPSADIGPYAVIDGPARLGSGVYVGPGAVVLGAADLGANCRVHSGAVVGDLPQDRAYAGTGSFVRIGAGTVLREHVTVHRAASLEEACSLLGESAGPR